MSKKRLNKNIKFFKKCLDEAIEFFGMYSYEFDLCVLDKEKCIKMRATANWWSLENTPNADQRIFSVCYSEEWLSKESNKKEIRTTAFHEILECMFYRLVDFSLNQNHVVSEREVDSEVHKIIRTFENKVFPLIKDPKK